MEDAAKLVDEARAGVRAVRESLRDPSAATLTQSWPLLQAAIDHLRKLQLLPHGVRRDRDAALRHSAVELQREVAQVEALLVSCVRFTSGWSCCLSATVSGYTPQGVLPLAAAGRQLSLEG